MNIQGTIDQIFEQETIKSAKGDFTKQAFVISTGDKYPKKTYISTWGDNTDALSALKPGDDVIVSVTLESREYNNRWYTEVKGTNIQLADQAPKKPINRKAAESPVEYKPTTSSAFEGGKVEDDDTLPF
jgi:hypothetical protein